jgi:hypothetical protein
VLGLVFGTQALQPENKIKLRSLAMFAPLIARKKPSATTSSSILQRQHSDAADRQAHTDDRNIWQRGGRALTGPVLSETGRLSDQTQMPLHHTGPAWDFSNIPIFPPDRQTSFSPLRLQPKLAIGSVNHPLEQEADRIAEEVMRMSGPDLSIAAEPIGFSRKCTESEEEYTAQKLPAKPAGSTEPATDEARPIVDEVLHSPGQPLDPTVRAFMEERFGHDFGGVRVHTNARAAESAWAVNAMAYTLGQNIVFWSGQYSPQTQEGKRLLAHELAHVVQQNDGGKRIQRAPAGKTKVKKLTVTKKGEGFDDFEAKRGGGKKLGYFHGWDSGSLYANFRFLVTAEVDGDINKCSYQQTLNRTTSFSKVSGDDTYAELNNRPLKTEEWVKVSGSTVMWQDAPGITSDTGEKKADLPYFFKGDFTQSATGEDGEKVGVSWSLDYELGKDEKWTKAKDDLDKSATHS